VAQADNTPAVANITAAARNEDRSNMAAFRVAPCRL
jgi:hypothetical protein